MFVAGNFKRQVESLQEPRMDKIREFLNKPLYAGIVGLVVGLIIGLPILGWWLFPVKWKDLDASTLRQDLKDQYLCMVVDSYRVNQNGELAKARLDAMGESLQKSPYLLDTLQKGGCNYAPDDMSVLALKSALLGAIPPVSGTPQTSGTIVPMPTQTEPVQTTGTSGWLLGVLCAVFLAIGGALIYIFFIRNRRTQRDEVPPAASEYEGDYQPDAEEEILPETSTKSYSKTELPGAVPVSMPGAGPVGHFVTTYVIGDDLYDDSFSIDAPSGEFLGECGVGISDTIGVGDPKKVTAFEVWLFDKNDIQTVTKVLMSSHAINDAAIRQRLASKGEPVLVEPGQKILLETATLQLEAHVIEMVYGQGALPSGSFFERMTLELAVYPKQ
jgi:hypothetical protein